MSDGNECELEKVQTTLGLIPQFSSFLESFPMFEMDYSCGTTETNFPLDYHPFWILQVGKAANPDKIEKNSQFYSSFVFWRGNVCCLKSIAVSQVRNIQAKESITRVDGYELTNLLSNWLPALPFSKICKII